MGEFKSKLLSLLSIDELESNDKLEEYYKLWVQSSEDPSILQMAAEYVTFNLL